MKIYLVGGAVRDTLLNLAIKERDWVVVGATEEQMIAKGFYRVGKDFPVFIHPESGEEYALARTERKTGHGYYGFSCHASPEVTLEEDLLRRDLTINAIAQAEDGQIIDPYNGQKDLENKILRHVSSAFTEDPVRILRLARFASRLASQQFSIANSTERLCRQMVRQGEVNALVPERVWQELYRTLACANPSVFFDVLRKCGALAVLFPEIDALYGVPNPKRWHPEIDSGVHTMMVLQQAVNLSECTRIRFAALVHDLGKACTPIDQWPSHKAHDIAGVEPINTLCRRLRVPKEYSQLAILATKYHILFHKARELNAATLLALLEKVDAFRRPERFRDLLFVCEADVRGRTGYEDVAYEQGDFLQKIVAGLETLDIKSLISNQMNGQAIKERIHSERLACIKRLLG